MIPNLVCREAMILMLDLFHCLYSLYLEFLVL